jgi:hypothetical protein
MDLLFKHPIYLIIFAGLSCCHSQNFDILPIALIQLMLSHGKHDQCTLLETTKAL